MIWHYDDIRRSISTGAIYNGILFYSDFSGFLHAVDVKTGKPFWKHDMFAAIWGSPMVIDDKVYLGDEDGDVTVLDADKTLKVVAESNMGSSVYSTPVPANGALFIVNRNELFAIAEHGRQPEASDAHTARRRGSPCLAAAPAAAQNWPSFRGPNAAGVAAASSAPPVSWDLALIAQRRLEGRHSRARALEPHRLGRSHLRHDRRAVERGTPTVVTGDIDKAGIDSAKDMVAHTWRLIAYRQARRERSSGTKRCIRACRA